MVLYLGLIWLGRPGGLGPRVFGADYFFNKYCNLLYVFLIELVRN
jgi:hypothetical protein